MRPILFLPVALGILFLLVSFLLFRRRTIPSRFFGLSLIVSGLLIASPIIYIVVILIKDLFGVVYTFVLGFALAILFLVSLVIYLILLVGEIRGELQDLWQEVALVKSEIDRQE